MSIAQELGTALLDWGRSQTSQTRAQLLNAINKSITGTDADDWPMMVKTARALIQTIISTPAKSSRMRHLPNIAIALGTAIMSDAGERRRAASLEPVRRASCR